jgi:hypothetical protein
MTTYYVVPETNGYGDWAIKRSGGIKVQNAQTQSTAVNQLRGTGPGKKGDQVIVYGNKKKGIVNQFTLS